VCTTVGAVTRAFLIPVIALSLGVGEGRGQTSQRRDSATASVGPSFDVTRNWIEKEMPTLTSAVELEENNDTLPDLVTVVRYSYSTRYEATEIRVRECQLIYKFEMKTTGMYSSSVSSGEVPTQGFSSVVQVPLKAVDRGSVKVEEISAVLPHRVRHSHPYQVKLTTRTTSDQPIIDNGTPERAAVIPVADEPAGERVVRALRRAAELCGAPASPF
jgi:hypothetical protein